MRTKKRKTAITKSFKVHANDGTVSIDIDVFMIVQPALVEDEVDHLKQMAARKIAESLQSLPYADFGIENITIGEG